MPEQYYDEDLNPISLSSTQKKEREVKRQEVRAPEVAQVYYDENLNPIELQPTTTDAQLKPDRSFLKRSIQQGSINVTENLPKILPVLGGILGSFAPGVGNLTGSALGGILGAALGTAGRGAIFEEPLEKVSQDTLNEVGMQAANELLFTGAPMAGRGLFRKLFRAGGNVDDLAALSKFPQLKPTVGQATGSRFARFVERNLSGSAKAEREAFQQQLGNRKLEIIRRDVSGQRHPTPKEVYGTQAQDVIKQRYKELGRLESSAWDKVRQDEVMNRVLVQQALPDGALIPKIIDGPIDYSRSAPVIKELRDEMNSLYDTLPGEFADKFKGFVKTINDMSTPVLTPQGPKFIYPHDTVKQLRTSIDDALEAKPLQTTRVLGALKRLKKTLGPDIEESVQNLWVNTPQAFKNIETARGLTVKKHEIFPNRVLGKVFDNLHTGKPADTSAVFNEAVKSPEEVREFIRALGPKEKNIIRGDFFERLQDEATTKATGVVDYGRIINELQDQNSTYRYVLSAPERKDIVEFSRAMQRVKPDVEKTGDIWIRAVGGNMALGLGAGLATGLVTGDAEKGAIGGALAPLTLLVSGRVFAQRVLLNPKYARLAAKLASQSTDTSENRVIRSILMGALRGAEALADVPGYDSPVDVIVGRDGKVHPR